MTRDFQLALTSGALYAASEIWLGQKFPLAKPIPLPVRMAVAGGLAVLAVVLAGKIVGAGTAHCDCGWSWDVIPNDPDPLLCHKCGSYAHT